MDHCPRVDRLSLFTSPHLSMESYDPDALREILSEILHDVNNPLSIIHGNAQFLMEVTDEDADTAHIREALRDIHDATNELSTRLRRLEDVRDEL